ncbi:MAG: GNAT family N-acetyltransferase [Clostridia bacterium]|nr:GNAT family N-acetyltransferase [Clostridia bacterium]
MSEEYVRYFLAPADFQKFDDPHVVLMDLQTDFDMIEPYYLHMGVDDMTADPFPEYVQAVGYVQNDVLLGFLMIMHLEEDGTLEMAAVSVRPELHGKGIGKPLISKAAEEIFAKGKIPSLTTKTTNIAMRRCAESIGMKMG